MFKLTLPVVLSGLALIVSITVLLFGNNITQKFQKSELVYQSQQMEIKYPEDLKLMRTISSNDTIPDYYREIKITNIGGSSSTNLKIVVTIDGEICDLQTKCLETITTVKRDSISGFEMTLNRLVKNADIDCKIWLKRKPGTLSLKSIDDQGMNDIKPYAEKSGFDELQLGASFSIIIILIIMAFRLYITPNRNRVQSLTNSNIELQEQNVLLANELEELKSNLEEKDTPKDVLLKLVSILKKYEKDV